MLNYTIIWLENPMSISITRIYTSPSFHPQVFYDSIPRHNSFLKCRFHFPRISNSHLNFNNAVPFTDLDNWTCLGRFNVHIHLRKVHGISDSHSYSAEQEDSVEKGDTPQERAWSTAKVLEQLKRYGVSGILSYGLLNTVYYLTTFLTVWFYFAPAPGKMGYLAAVSRFLKIMAMVWAGSQVTKLFRAAGALALAPVVDRGLSWFTDKFKFKSRGKAFVTIVGFCFGLAAIMFLIVTLLSA